MTDQPRLHHYIPRFHLRQFGHGDGDGRIWVFDKTTDAITRRSVKSIAAELDYYRIRDGRGGSHDDLEQLFQKIESAAAPIIKDLAALPAGSHPLSFAARDIVAGYMAVLHARGPAYRERTRAMGQFFEVAQMEMTLRNPPAFRKWARKAHKTMPAAEVEELRLEMLRLLESGELRFEAPVEWGLMGLSAAIDHIRPMLTGMRWYVLRRHRLPFLVLGDAPVVISRPESLPSFLGAGFGTPGVEVSMPLSATALLTLTHEPTDGDLTVLDPDPLPHRPAMLPDWPIPLHESTFFGAARYVFGQSQADLEFTRFSMSVEARTKEPKVYVRGVPDPWRRYAPGNFEFLDDHEREASIA